MPDECCEMTIVAGWAKVEKIKLLGKGMNVARQISRRFVRTIGARTCSDSSDCIIWARPS